MSSSLDKKLDKEEKKKNSPKSSLKASLRVEDDEQSVRQLRSLKPPPRTADSIDDTKKRTLKSKKHSSAPELELEEPSLEVAAAESEATWQQPPLESSEYSRRRSNRNVNSCGNDNNDNQSKSPSPRPRRVGRRNKDRGDPHSPTKKKRRPVKSWSSLRDAVENHCSSNIDITAHENNTEQQTQRQDPAPSLPNTESRTPHKPSIETSGFLVNKTTEQGKTTATSSTTTDARNQKDLMHPEKVRTREEQISSPLVKENGINKDDGGQSSEMKPSASPGAFHVSPSGGDSNNNGDAGLDEEMGEKDGVTTAHVAPVAAAPVEQRRDTGPEKQQKQKRSSLPALSNVGTSIPIAAEVVPDQDELERRMEEEMQERLKREVEKRLQQERERQVFAEAVYVEEGSKRSRSGENPSVDESSTAAGQKRKKMIIIGGVIIGVVVLLAAVIGGIVSNKNKYADSTKTPTIETTDRYKAMVDTIGTLVASDPTVFFTDMESPQYKAMDWISNEDSWVSPDRTPDMLVDRYSLAVLYFSTGGPKWKQQFTFLQPTSICTWNDGSSIWASNASWFEGAGIYCGSDEVVQEIWLGSTKAAGSLPTELGLFSHLTAFQMFDSFLTGTLPTEIFSIHNLTLFDIVYGQGVAGSIPSEIGLATNLEILQLGGNGFDGLIPEELYQLTLLTHLDLFECAFSGPMSTSIAKLSNLNSLDLSVNRFLGSLPEELYTLTQLTTLLLFSNLFTGNLSPEIGNMSEKLSEFDFGDNTFGGTLPTELGYLQNLNKIWLEDNQFTGTVPSEIGSLPFLETFSIFDNPGIGGQFPTSFRTGGKLSDVRLQNTNVWGVEEAFCSRDYPIDNLSADCLVQVECTCCTMCCVDGRQCRGMR
ncbi:two component regulator [Nitzschia inconspicua]|uniref:Two component regulator n=1 Tax=Nitzschia inconspicua TaxID=303405 RepID=A0A9K3M1T2_9STRA|nr:two component regulator [Nitzschia inconspicua]